MARGNVPALGAAMVALLLVSGVSAADVVLVSSTEEGIVVRCEPGDVGMRVLTTADREYAVLSVEGADAMGMPGAPDVPVLRAVLAVPDCDQIVHSIATFGTSAGRGPTVLPALTMLPVDEGRVSRSAYLEGEEYERSGLWPSSAAVVSEPRNIRDQRVVHVEFYPCQVDASSGSFVTHDAIELTLSFAGVRGGGRPRRQSGRAEDLLRAVLLNYESGRDWRGRREPAAGRPDEYFDSSANWLKMTVDGRGMYSVDHDALAAADVDPEDVDPASIRVFAGSGLPVPAPLFDPRPDWMTECEIVVEGEADGAFDEGDRVVFYALGADGWSNELEVPEPEERYYENEFTGDAVYWMTWESEGTPFAEAPLRMAEDDLQDEPSPTTVTDYRARAHFEDNRYEREGRGDGYFMSELMGSGPEERYFHELLFDVVTDSTGSLRVRVDGNSSEPEPLPDHYAVFYLNDVEAVIGEWDGYTTYIAEAEGLPIRDYLPDEPGSSYNTMKIYVPRADTLHAEDTILLDWFELGYWRELWADADPTDEQSDDQLFFGSSGRTGVLEYSLDGFETDGVSVYKIMGRYSVRTVPGVETLESGRGFGATFQDEVADTASYAAVADGGYLAPSIERDVPAMLRSDEAVDYVMITYDGFYEEAERLRSYRESEAGGGFNVRLCRVSDVYDEFSWGMFDPTAIRDYLRYLHDNAAVAPTHVLLIGDATTDYRHYLTTGINCYLPSYYTGREYWPTDFWFVGFDAETLYEPAMALGRLPARSVGELSTLTDKILRYEQETVQGLWKNTVVLVGDDEYKGNQNDPYPHLEYAHTEQAEQISVEVLPWPIDRRKIYLMEYEYDVYWRKPAARVDLIDTWNEGALVMNYTGHGGEDVIAHEIIFVVDDIARLKNIDGLPLFFAASCRLNKFDMPSKESVGELLTKSPAGGAIGSIGSTRDSGAGYNSNLNRAFLGKCFGDQREVTTAFMDIGQALQAGFISSASSAGMWTNNTKFMLVGDPAVRFVSPNGWGELDDDGLEPMKRRDTVTLDGTNAGSTEGEDGIALVRVTESADISGYVQPITQYHVEYSIPGEPLFEGSAVVSDGAFSTDVVISELADQGPHARIRALFYGEDIDGAFSLENVTIADSVEVTDFAGPDISMAFEGGGTSVLPGSELEVTLSDESGINMVNRDSGDGIVLAVDGGPDSTDVTGEFAYDLGSSREGAIRYELPSLALGGHSIVVSASDNIGNRSTETLQFEVVSSTEFVIRNVANSPNPFPEGSDSGTHILFQLPVEATVTIDVFTVGGRRVRRLGDIAGSVGANEVYWDGLDAEGDELANGVYLYRIHATSNEYRGDKAEVIGRAVIMR